MDRNGRIAFIGGGNMAEALVRGILPGNQPASVIIAEPLPARREALAQRYAVTVTADNREAAAGADLLLLAVKPQMAAEVLAGIADVFTCDKLLISILAGTPTRALEEPLGKAPRVVRAMPNTPALVGAGATALCGGRYAGQEDLAAALRLFETVGTVQMVGEGQMDAVTGLSGSGPAYVFTLIEALADGGVKEGLPRATALALATQTVLGAARMVREGEHPAVLRDRVCSPGGTTIAGVKALEDRGFRAALMEAVTKAAERSRELGRT
ncbi:MAG: pyrroline-5-carboxylate reductase [Desulfuromonadales bacterium]